MRDFKGMKRQRGRNRPGGQGGGGGGKPGNANRSFDSQGPENLKVRGSAQHIFEKYQQLARDATGAGDRVLLENYLQHAEHYYRLIRTLQPQRTPAEIMGRESVSNGYDLDFEDESLEAIQNAAVEAGAAQADEAAAEEARSDGQGREARDREARDRDARDREFRDRGEYRRDREGGEFRRDREGGSRDFRDAPREGQREFRDAPRDFRDAPREGQREFRDGPRDAPREGQREFRDGPREPRGDRESRRDRPRDGEPRPEGRFGDRGRYGERPREDGGVPEVEGSTLAGDAQSAPFSPSADGEMLRDEEGGLSPAPAFLQSAVPAPAPASDEDEPRTPRPRRRRTRAAEPAASEVDGAAPSAPSNEGEEG